MVDIIHKGKTYRVEFPDREMYLYVWQTTDYYCLFCGKQSVIGNYKNYKFEDEDTIKYCLECNCIFYCHD